MISETWKKGNDRIISWSVTHTQALWQIIKKESGFIKKQIKTFLEK
jgi:hypothetical protein